MFHVSTMLPYTANNTQQVNAVCSTDESFPLQFLFYFARLNYLRGIKSFFLIIK